VRDGIGRDAGVALALQPQAVLELPQAPCGRHRAAYWLLKASANLGKMSIFLGWHYREYGHKVT